MKKALILIIIIMTIVLASISFVILFSANKVEERSLIINDSAADTIAVIKKHYLRKGYYLPFTKLLTSLGYEVVDSEKTITIQKENRIFRIYKDNFELIEDGKSLDYFAIEGKHALKPFVYKDELYFPTAMVQAALQNLGYSFKWNCDNSCLKVIIEEY